jgi:putative ABC transport system substrate-binding protein
MLGCVLALIAWIGATALPGPNPCDASRFADLLIASARAAEARPAAKIHRVGFVSPTAPGARDEAFVNGLRELGYVDGRNVRLVMRFAEGRPERIAGLVDELVRLEVDVMVVGATIGARAAKSATASIPIVFAGSSDPVAGGIVRNLARPEGNVTGTSLAVGEAFAGKWLELLEEAIPNLGHAAVLWSSSNPAARRFVDEIRNAARKLHVTVDVHHAATAAELDVALAAIAGSGARGLVVTPSPFAAASQERLVSFAADRRLPAIYFAEDFAIAGGFMSYGPSIAEAYARAAGYVDRILRLGARPADLPVGQPERFELVVNAATARALGLTVPHTILLRARVIE